jgi:hypothetical protein
MRTYFSQYKNFNTMAETVVITENNVPTGIRSSLILKTATTKTIESEWAGFNELFGITEINGRQLYYFKNGSNEPLKYRSYFETYMHIPNKFSFLTGANLENSFFIGDGIPDRNLLPIFVNNVMKTKDTNVCAGLEMAFPRNQEVTVTYKMKNDGLQSNRPPLSIPPEPYEGRATCVQPIIGANGEMVVLYSKEKIPLPDYLEAKYSQANSQANSPNYYIPTLMPNLSVCFIVTPDKELVQKWVTYLNSINTAFSGAVDPEVLPIDKWKCFIAFVDKVPDNNLETFTLTSDDKKFKLKGTSHGGIRFVENLNLRR